jgi:hypothetical protein
MRYKHNGSGGAQRSVSFLTLRMRSASGGQQTMTRHSNRSKVFLASTLLVPVACFAFAGTLAASKYTYAGQALDRLIPQDEWAETGLDRLTPAEQRTLAGQITTLLGAKQSADSQNAAPEVKDRTQWRKLQRRMSKDEVRKLLGEPFRVSVSRYYESWDYTGGTVTFDSKGHLDFWSES